MISGIQIQNLRSLVDTGRLPLRRVNVLVGKNSSGKSTFLRLFPLLRQSIEVRTKGPLLWYGRLVDFGSFSEARSSVVTDERITLSFDVHPKRGTSRKTKRVLAGTFTSHRLPKVIRVSLVVGQHEKDAVGYLSKVDLQIGVDRVEIDLRGPTIKSISINSQNFTPEAGQFWYAPLDGLLPNVSFFIEQKAETGTFYAIDDSSIWRKIVSKLHHVAHGNTLDETLTTIAQQLQYYQPPAFISQFKSLSSAPWSLVSRLENFPADSTYIQSLRALVLLASLPSILRELGSSLEGFAQGVRYIEPLRATAERYYRLQDLAVDEIDSSGANTAMFLHSLDAFELSEMQDWMDKHLGFRVYPERSTGHVAVKIKTKNDELGRNIADLGFGYSQVIPIVLQLWHCCVRSTPSQAKEASLIAIEQPELHLHPSYQSLLADVLAAVSNSLKEEDVERPIVVETHSEHIVNRLGALIANGTMEPDDVGIFLFEHNNGRTDVRQVQYDKLGILPDSWPLGFFLPEV